MYMVNNIDHMHHLSNKSKTWIFYYRVKYIFCPYKYLTFRFSPSKKFLQLLVLQNIFIFTFDLSFKINSYVKFIFLNKFLFKKIIIL